MWVYGISDGWFGRSKIRLALGYSGNGEGLNNILMQDVHNIGPCPCGFWYMKEVINSPEHGPFAIVLTSGDGKTHNGRGGFMMHGDNKRGDYSASKGCIILPHHARVTAWDSGDRMVEVVERGGQEGDEKWPNS